MTFMQAISLGLVFEVVALIYFVSDLHGRLDCHRQLLDGLLTYLEARDPDFQDTLAGLLKQ